MFSTSKTSKLSLNWWCSNERPSAQLESEYFLCSAILVKSCLADIRFLGGIYVKFFNLRFIISFYFCRNVPNAFHIKYFFLFLYSFSIVFAFTVIFVVFVIINITGIQIVSLVLFRICHYCNIICKAHAVMFTGCRFLYSMTMFSYLSYLIE